MGARVRRRTRLQGNARALVFGAVHVRSVGLPRCRGSLGSPPTPSVCHGQPTIRRLRYPVAGLLGLPTSGMTIPEILEGQRDRILKRVDRVALSVRPFRAVRP